jgi:DNA-binding XRE family transcriptional regulator
MKRTTGQETLGRTLRAIREDSGLTQAEVAAKAGLLRQAVIRIEADKSDPAWSTVVKIAEAIGAEVSVQGLNEKRADKS